MCIRDRANVGLPDQIRASFTVLLLRVWIDRYPHNALPIPDQIQVMGNIKPVNKINTDFLPQFEVDANADFTEEERAIGFLPFGSAPGECGSCKFHLCEDFIIGYLNQVDGCQVAKEKEKNIFTIAVLSLVELFAAFGFYGSQEELSLIHISEPTRPY